MKTLSPESRQVILGATMENLKPVGARVTIKVESINTMTSGGLIIPEAIAEAQRPARGVVLQTGADCKTLEKGDYVVFMMYAGSFIEDADEEKAKKAIEDKVIYRIVRESEVFGVWKKGDWRYGCDEFDNGDPGDEA